MWYSSGRFRVVDVRYWYVAITAVYHRSNEENRKGNQDARSRQMGAVRGACNAPDLLSIPFSRPFLARGA
jgi:hypothetical protein